MLNIYEFSLPINLEAGLWLKYVPKEKHPLHKVLVSTVDFTEDSVQETKRNFWNTTASLSLWNSLLDISLLVFVRGLKDYFLKFFTDLTTLCGIRTLIQRCAESSRYCGRARYRSGYPPEEIHSCWLLVKTHGRHAKQGRRLCSAWVCSEWQQWHEMGP